MKEQHWLLAIVLGVVFLGGERAARADFVLLTYEGLRHGEEVLSYYAGGTGSLGSGPGPNYGVTFTSTGVALTHGNYSGEPTPPTIMMVARFDLPGGASPLSTTMDVTPGFQGPLSFFYAALDAPGRVDVYSGLDGTGALLASQTLSVTSNTTGLFVADQVNFAGVAHSAVYTGANQQLAFDNMSFSTPVPEPSTLSLFVLGGLLWLGGRLRRQESRVGRTPSS
jgi:hypothetical protein